MTNCGNIPEGLRNIPQWLFASNRPGKEKAPCNESGKPIDATDPSTWHTFDEVSTHLDSAEFDSTLLLHYPGFSFSPSDPYIFIDVDLYRIQNENVRIEAEAWMKSLGTYLERSSGKGLHAILRLKEGEVWSLPWSKRRHLEVYFRHFGILTGDEASGEIRTVSMEEMKDAIAKFPGIGRVASAKKPASSAPFKDTVQTLEDVLNKIKLEPDSNKFFAVFGGSLAYHDGDESAADFYLCQVFARFTHDVEKIKSFWGQSKLAERPKFNRPGYAERTIRSAIKYDNSRGTEMSFEGRWFEPNLHIIDDKLYSFNSSLQHIRLSLADFGVKYISDLAPVFAKVSEQGRRYGAGYTLEHLSTTDASKPLVQFHTTGIRLYYPLRQVSVPESEKKTVLENTHKFFEFLFGEHTNFILDWLAIYVCRNHLRLPTIILTGARGTGKGSFLDFITNLFPDTLSSIQHDLPTDFDDWRTKKFLGLDEFFGSGERGAYDALKSVQGSTTFTVNVKHEPRFKTFNNLSVVVTTNERFPIYCEVSEIPTSPNRNSWFALHLGHVKPGFIDEGGNFRLTAIELKRVIQAAPFFAQEVLIPRYAGLAKDVAERSIRWPLPTPITPDVLLMFHESRSALDFFSERVLERILEERAGEVALTEQMIICTLEGPTRLVAPPKVGSNPEAIRRRLQKLGWIGEHRNKKTKTTKGDGYPILRQPEKDEEADAERRPYPEES
jgi:hypothetical protein